MEVPMGLPSRRSLFVAAVVSAALVVSCLPAAANDRVAPRAEVTTTVAVRETASADSAALAALAPGQTAELLGSVPYWYEVRLGNGIEGFVSKRWTTIVTPGAVLLDTGGAAATAYTVDVVDVGTGLGVLVRGPDFNILYDAGSNDDQAIGADNRMVAFIKHVAPSLTTLDHVILSHPHTDHVLLLPDVLSAFTVKNVWDSGRFLDVCGYRGMIEYLKAHPEIQYHTAVQNGGTRDYTFAAKTCPGRGSLTAATINVKLSAVLDANDTINLDPHASMTFLHADGADHGTPNENSVVVKFAFASARVLLVGDAQGGDRASPSTPPKANSTEGVLLACCKQALASDVLVVGHHGSMTSSRKLFLDAVMASNFIVSSGPTKYNTVTLPDSVVINELKSRGTVFDTYHDDAQCRTSTTKIGPGNDGQVGGCDNVRVSISATGAVNVAYLQ
jgi:competence protein ComEC